MPKTPGKRKQKELETVKAITAEVTAPTEGVPDYFISDDPKLWEGIDRQAVLTMVAIAHDLNSALEHIQTRRHTFNAKCLACQNIARSQARYRVVARRIYKR